MIVLLLSPDAAILLATVGILLIYVELNRPGLIFPGAVGLLFALLAIAALLPQHFNPIALVLITCAIILLGVDLLRPTPRFVPLLTAALLSLGLFFLQKYPTTQPVHLPVAASCGLILGAGTSLLTRVARRARANKGLDLERARTSRPGASQS